MTDFLHVNSVTCAYEQNIVLKDLSFTIGKGEIACLLGPSGCGKSTLLRAIAGFESLQGGQILLSGNILSDTQTIMAPEKRRIGMVFQDYALFPHMTISQNIAYGLAKDQKKGATSHINKLLSLVDLDGYENRFPHELSGGQQQRVALARALAPEPELILLDEPFSNLDADLRSRLGVEVRDILKSLNISAILVTHDQSEAFAMSDNIGLINAGKIAQWGTPYDLYHEPSSRFVAQFIGRGSFLQGTNKSHESFSTELGVITGNRAYPWPAGTEVEILVRPDDVLYDADSEIVAKIISKTFAGTSTHYILELGSGAHIEAALPSHQNFPVGGDFHIHLDTEHLVAFNSAI